MHIHYSIGKSDRVQNPKVKNGFNYFPFDSLERLIEAVKYDWTPSIYIDGERTIQSFQYSDFLYIDVDSGFSISEFMEEFKTLEFFLITSRNHQKGKVHAGVVESPCDRYHVLFPVEKRYDNLDHLKADFRDFTEYYSFVDKSATPGGRFFYGVHDAKVIHNEGKAYNNTGNRQQDSFTGEEVYSFDPELEDEGIQEYEREGIRKRLSAAYEAGAFDEYADWVKMGLALKSCGFTLEDFKSITYDAVKEANIIKKWSSFPATSAVGVGSIYFYLDKAEGVEMTEESEEEQNETTDIEIRSDFLDQPIVCIEYPLEDGDADAQEEGQALPKRLGNRIDEAFYALELNHDGNTKRFLSLFRGDVKYCAEQDVFFIWDETRWIRDLQNAHLMAVIMKSFSTLWQLFESFAKKVPLEKTKAKYRKLFATFYNSTLSASGVTGVISLLKGEKSLWVKESAFDADPYLFNCANGIIDLRTSALSPHNRASFCSKISPYQYNKKAEAPIFRKFLSTIMEEDEEKACFLLQWFAFCLSALPPPRKNMFLLGDGANGKSTLVNIVAEILGEYHKAASTDSFTLKKGGGSAIRSDFYHMMGHRMISAQESSPGERLNEAALKEFSGGDMINCRNLYSKTETSFKNTGKLVFSTNHKPTVGGGDDAIWNRIILVDFNYQVPENEQDHKLFEKLVEEAEGILALLVSVFKFWHLGGEQLVFPASVIAAVDEYRREEDKIAQFLEASVVMDDKSKVKVSELYKAFKTSSDSRGDTYIVSLNKFGRQLSKSFRFAGMNPTKSRNSEGYYYIGVRIKDGTFM